MNHWKENHLRVYRKRVYSDNLVSYTVVVRETDLLISTDTDLSSLALESVYKYRRFIEYYINIHPDFLTSLDPVPMDKFAPDIIGDMIEASFLYHVGPMASVAGAIAQYVGRDLLVSSENVIVENGGDIFISLKRNARIGIFAGDSAFGFKVSLNIRSDEMPLGICTSSATVGPSLSLGSADAVCVKSDSAILADAAATAIGNIIKDKKDIKTAIRFAQHFDKSIRGVVIIIGDHLGAWGDIELS
jgi:ApbE superfamily uncharacterized protein (UPF0280 family)